MNVIVTTRKQYRSSAAVWWHCECGCTYGCVRADDLDACDEYIALLADLSKCRTGSDG